MRTPGKFLRFAIIIIFLGFIGLLTREGKFSPVWENVQGLFSGKKEHKLTFADYEFKPVIRKDIYQKVLATGTVTLKTGAEVKIGARISGQLEKLMVKIGDIVRAGDMIATIEHEDLLARVAQFAADLRAEEARLAKIRGEGPLEINKLKATLEELNAQISLARKMFSRNQTLRKKGIVSDTLIMFQDEILPNQSLSEILLKFGVSYAEIDQIAKKSKAVFDVRKFNSGKNYLVFCSDDSVQKAQYFVYEQDAANYIIYGLMDPFPIDKGRKEVEIEIKMASGIINSKSAASYHFQFPDK